MCFMADKHQRSCVFQPAQFPANCVLCFKVYKVSTKVVMCFTFGEAHFQGCPPRLYGHHLTSYTTISQGVTKKLLRVFLLSRLGFKRVIRLYLAFQRLSCRSIFCENSESQEQCCQSHSLNLQICLLQSCVSLSSLATY